MRGVRAAGVAACVALLVVTGCGSDASESNDDTLTVLAASSLTDAFSELEKSYEAEHDVDVKISYDSSSVLASQVVEGAPADVLATADERTMGTVADADLVEGEPRIFAENTLTIVTPPDNPAQIRGLRDFARDDVKVAVCVPEAPCGDASERLLELANVDAQAATQEQNVKSVLTKVTLGEVDAGLVYVSDAQAAGDDVTTVPAARSSRVVNSDPIAVLSDAANGEAAQEWVDLVMSKKGQRVLKSYGFQPGA